MTGLQCEEYRPAREPARCAQRAMTLRSRGATSASGTEQPGGEHCWCSRGALRRRRARRGRERSPAPASAPALLRGVDGGFRHAGAQAWARCQHRRRTRSRRTNRACSRGSERRLSQRTGGPTTRAGPRASGPAGCESGLEARGLQPTVWPDCWIPAMSGESRVGFRRREQSDRLHPC
jgi:hypothetical protein